MGKNPFPLVSIIEEEEEIQQPIKKHLLGTYSVLSIALRVGDIAIPAVTGHSKG